MPGAEGFAWTHRKNGDVVITHRGRPATVLRDARATDFLDDITAGNEQDLMARLAGNYRRGNERLAHSHPRNR